MRYPDRGDRRGRQAGAAAAARPQRPLHIRLALFLGAALGMAVLLVYPAASVATDPEYNGELVFCTSSIDIKCQPANLPILMEFGIASGGGVTTATGVAASAALNPSIVTGAGIVGLGTVLAGETIGPGALGIGGISNQVIKTDPGYSNGGREGFFPDRSICSGSWVGGWFLGYDSCNRVLEVGVELVGELHPVYGSANSAVITVDIRNMVDPFAGAVQFRRYCYDTGDDPSLTSSYSNTVTTLVNENGSLNSNWGGSGSAKWTSGQASMSFSCPPGDLVARVTTISQGLFPSESNSLWFGPMLPGAPVAGPDGITGTVTSTVTCRPTAGGSDYVVTETLSMTVASGHDMPIPDAQCAPGDIAVSGSVGWTPQGGTMVELVPETFAPTEVVELPNDYPDCFNGAVQGCKLELWKIGLGGSMESCGSVGQLCQGWAQHPDPASQYQCMYGPYPIHINACSAYRAPEVGILPNVDDEGDWLPPSAPIPNPLPNDTGTGTAPGGANFPVGELGPDGQPTNCWPTGWGVFNPFSWVFQPVMCAAQALFVPRQSVLLATATATQEAWSNSIIGHAEDQVDQILTGLPNVLDAGCLGPPVVFGTELEDFGMTGTWFPLNSCDEPMATVRTIAYWALPAFTAFGLAFALVRYVAAILGFVALGGTTVHTNNNSSSVRFQ